MLQEGKSRKNENTGDSQLSEKQQCSPSHASRPFINYTDTIVVQVTGPGRKTGFIRANYVHGVKEKCVVNLQALIQELTETKAKLCSQKIGSEEGLMTIGAKKWFSPQNK